MNSITKRPGREVAPALTHAQQVALVTTIARTEDRLARDLLADPSGYFTPETNPRSIASHFVHFRKTVGDLSVLQVDQLTVDFAVYLQSKKVAAPESAQLRLYVADKTLVATFDRGEMLSEPARRRVTDLVNLRSILAAVAQVHARASREFRELLDTGEVSLEQLPRAAVEKAFDSMQPLLIERIGAFALGGNRS